MGNGKPLPPGQVKFKVYIKTEDGSMSFSLRPGDTHQLSVTVKNKSGVDITTRCTFIWTSSNTAVATVSSTGLVTGAGTQGSCNVTVKATYQGSSATSAPTSVTNLGAITPPPIPIPPDPTPIPPSGDAEADLPREFYSTNRADTPSLGSTIVVNDGDDLQAKYDSAAAGDILELASGSTFPVSLRLYAKSGQDAGHYITFRKSGTLPTEHSRIANSTGFPRIRAMNVNPAAYTDGQAAFIRFIGIEFDIDPALTDHHGAIVRLGDGSTAQNDVTTVAHHIILDCCSVHTTENQDCRKGISADIKYFGVIDSRIYDIHSGFDAQCVTATNGIGIFKIDNNYLEASGENIAWGGATSWLGINMTDIMITRNHMFKPLAWKSKPWNVKLHYEAKQSQRVLLRGNVMENCWPSGQNGFSIATYSADAGDVFDFAGHHTFLYNLVKNVTGLANTTSTYQDGVEIPSHHLTFKHNVVIGQNGPDVHSNVPMGFFIGNPSGRSDTNLKQYVIRHNTLFNIDTLINFGPSGLIDQLMIEDNMMGGFAYGFRTDGSGLNSAAWNHVAGAGSSIKGNAFPWWTVNQIGGNMYPANTAELGLANGDIDIFDPNTPLASYGLASSSSYKNQASDGTDPGADVDTLSTEIAGVV